MAFLTLFISSLELHFKKSNAVHIATFASSDFDCCMFVPDQLPYLSDKNININERKSFLTYILSYFRTWFVDSSVV